MSPEIVLAVVVIAVLVLRAIGEVMLASPTR